MTDLNHIKELTLLGTNRKNLDIQQVPNPLRNVLFEDDEDAQKLLNLYTYLTYYLKHGEPLKKMQKPFATKLVTEESPFVSDEISALLVSILNLEFLSKEDLLLSWMEMVVSRKEIIHPALILPLKASLKLSNKNTLENFLQIIGNRGRAFAMKDVKDSFQEIKSDEEWQTAPSKLRKKYLSKLRKVDPSRANKLILETWESENIREKYAFLEILTSSLQRGDEDLVFKIYEDEFKGTKAQKPVTRKCKMLLIGMLARLENKEVIGLLNSFFQPYTAEEKKKGLVNKMMRTKQLVISLPENPDEKWNGHLLKQHFGFEEKNQDIRLFDEDPLYWLSCFIEILPVSYWKNLLKLEEKEIIRYFLFNKSFRTTIKNENTAIFQQAILDNALKSKNKNFIHTLTEILDGEDLSMLYPSMSKETYEKHIMRNKTTLNVEAFLLRDGVENATWSVHYSKNIISELFKMCKNGRFMPHVKFGMVISKFYNREAIKHLSSITNSALMESWGHNWQKNIDEPIRTSVNIKEKIETYQKS